MLAGKGKGPGLTLALGPEANLLVALEKLYSGETTQFTNMTKSFLMKYLNLSQVFLFIKEKMFYYSFYLYVVLVEFFTRNKIGHWFYFFTVFFVLWGGESPSYNASYLFTSYIIGLSVLLALIKIYSPGTTFMGKILGGQVIDDLIPPSPLQLIINSFKPYFFAALLHLIIFFREVAQIEAYDEKLQNLYGGVAVTIEPLGLKGAVTELNSFLCNLSAQHLFILLVICFLVFLFSLWEKK